MNKLDDGRPNPTPPDSRSTSPTLMDKIRSPERSIREPAWERFRTRYAPIVAGFARNQRARTEDVEDVVQEVMTSFSAVKFVHDPERGRLRGYLKTCAVNALNRLRKQAGKFQQIPEDLDPSAQAVEQSWADVWENESLRQALTELREEYRNRDSDVYEMFDRYVLQGKDPKTVAQEMACSVDSVYSAKHRVTGELRQRMRKLDDGEE